MTGEVRGIETAFNVRLLAWRPPPADEHWSLTAITIQNFFTNVKALVSQAEAEGPKLDSKNHFQQAERELTDRCASPSYERDGAG